MTLGRFIKRLLKERKMSQAELSRLSGVPTTRLNEIIKEKCNNPSFSRVARLMKPLGKDLNEVAEAVVFENTRRQRYRQWLGKSSCL